LRIHARPSREAVTELFGTDSAMRIKFRSFNQLVVNTGVIPAFAVTVFDRCRRTSLSLPVERG